MCTHKPKTSYITILKNPPDTTLTWSFWSSLDFFLFLLPVLAALGDSRPFFFFFFYCFYSVTTYCGFALALLFRLTSFTFITTSSLTLTLFCMSVSHVRLDMFVSMLYNMSVFFVIFYPCVLYDFMCVGEEVKVGDIPKPSLPSILPKKPLPPKTSSSSSSQPPRRPERPPTLASVHTHTNTHTSHNLLSVHSLMLLYGLPAQVWKPQVWGRGFDTRFCPWQVTWRWWVWLTGAGGASVTVRALSLCLVWNCRL